MTDQRELDRLLGAFFVEGTNEVADRVIDAALIEIDQTKQRRVRRMPRRFLTMKMPMRLAVAAVVGVIAVGGTLYAVNPWQSALAPTSTPASSVGPSASTGPSVIPAAGPTWTVTGRMVVPRSGAATLLPDGTVLVVGGAPIARETEAELFDPVSGTWSETRRTGSSQGNPATVLLPGGTVLVAGGGSAGELYDPRTKSWTAAADGMPRSPDGGFPGNFEAMFVLGDGKVLAIGRHRRTALYDPGSRSWTAGADLVEDRYNFQAILLGDGRVLAVGGDLPPDQPTATAEIYDPATGRWTATGSMSLERHDSHTLTRLPDGRVLVVAGNGCFSCDVTSHETAELYDPRTGSWTDAAPMLAPLSGQSATLLSDGKVLVAGGVEAASSSGLSAELYDPETDTWAATAGMAGPRSGHRATLLLDGRVLVNGGERNESPVVTSEIYDPGHGT